MMRTVIRSSFAGGTPSTPSDSNLGLRSSTNSRFGSDFVMANGPVAGGGFLVWFSNGVSRGTGVASVRASRWSNAA